MFILHCLIFVFQSLVKIARLLLRHKVKYSERGTIPICVRQLIKDFKLINTDIEWHELYCYNMPDGVFQCKDEAGERILVVWISMNEVFRYVYFGINQCIREYQVTVSSFIWEPLLAESELVKTIEEKLKLNTELGKNFCLTIKLIRYVSDKTLIEVRTTRSMERNQENPTCLTEKRIYRHNVEDEYMLHRKILWKGYPEEKPREETEVVYDRNLKPYQTIKRQVDKNGTSDEYSYDSNSSIPNRTIVQMYDETHSCVNRSSTGVRRRQPKTITDVGVSKVYNLNKTQ